MVLVYIYIHLQNWLIFRVNVGIKSSSTMVRIWVINSDFHVPLPLVDLNYKDCSSISWWLLGWVKTSTKKRLRLVYHILAFKTYGNHHMYIYIYTYKYVYIYIHTRIYIYIYIHGSWSRSPMSLGDPDFVLSLQPWSRYAWAVGCGEHRY